jgi:hypothetical protein
MFDRSQIKTIAAFCVGLAPVLITGFVTSWSGPVGHTCLAIAGTVLLLIVLVTLLATLGFITEWFSKRHIQPRSAPLAGTGNTYLS